MIYDYTCDCGNELKDVIVHDINEIVICECGKNMIRLFPTSGSFIIDNTGVKKLKNKYGNRAANVPKKSPDNGFKMYGKKKDN